jgi:hypothetical protein
LLSGEVKGFEFAPYSSWLTFGFSILSNSIKLPMLKCSAKRLYFT